MKHIHLLRYIPLLTILLSTAACQKEINFNIQTNDKRLLVDAEFTDESSIHSVELSRTGSLLNERPMIPVTGATICITDGIDTFYFTENSSTPEKYQTTHECHGIGGKTYTLSISNVDIDEDGKLDEFSAHAKMPVAVIMDSLVSKRGLHPSDKTMGVNNYAYFRVAYNGPDYVYKFMEVNQHAQYTIHDKLGSGEIGRAEGELKILKPTNPELLSKTNKFLHISDAKTTVNKGDTLTFVCLNLTNEYFQFLKEFDNYTSFDLINDNFYDQIKMPKNLPTNIEPSNKAAGYFSVISVSKISKILNE